MEASSFFSKENGVWLAFSPKTVAKPKRVTCYSWSRSAEVVRLEDDETLVSSIIQLECDDPAGVTFTGITLALSHSAVESKEYELVMKELINTEEKTWKDLKTPIGMLPVILINKKNIYTVRCHRIDERFKFPSGEISYNFVLLECKDKNKGSTQGKSY